MATMTEALYIIIGKTLKMEAEEAVKVASFECLLAERNVAAGGCSCSLPHAFF